MSLPPRKVPRLSKEFRSLPRSRRDEEMRSLLWQNLQHVKAQLRLIKDLRAQLHAAHVRLLIHRGIGPMCADRLASWLASDTSIN